MPSSRYIFALLQCMEGLLIVNCLHKVEQFLTNTFYLLTNGVSKKVSSTNREVLQIVLGFDEFFEKSDDKFEKGVDE